MKKYPIDLSLVGGKNAKRRQYDENGLEPKTKGK
jgi:hypothetical protein